MAKELTDQEKAIIQQAILDRWNPHRLTWKIANHFDLSVNQIRHIKSKAMQELLLSFGATPRLPQSGEALAKAVRSADILNEHLVTKVFAADDTALHDLFFEHHAGRVPTLVPGDIWGGELPSLALLERLLDRGLDVNRPNWIGRTFLHVAAEKGTPQIAAALLEAGADLEAVELEHGGTPLAAAARSGRAEMVGFLLERGADADAPEQSPWATARAWAARSDDAEMRRLLESPVR